MSVRRIGSIEDLRALVGTEVGASEWLTVDQDRVDRFAGATGDHQWIHVDVDRATRSGFGGTIVHGYLTLSLIPVLAREIMVLSFGSARLNYGLNAVRFPAPLPTASRIRARGTVLDVRSLPKGEQLTMSYTIDVDGAGRPACVAEALTLIVP